VEQIFDIERVPPHDLEAEMAVLGSILLDPESDHLSAVARILDNDALYSRRHQLIYGAMIACRERGDPPDPLLVAEELARASQLDDVGGRDYLIELAETVVTPAHVTHYARLVAQKAVSRRLLPEVEDLRQAVGSNGRDPRDLLREAAERFRGLVEDYATIDVLPEPQTAEQIIASEEVETPWLAEGFLPARSVTMIVGKPKVGKSTLVYHLLACLERGVDFLGRPTEATRALVLAEESVSTIKEKVERFGIRHAAFYTRAELGLHLPWSELIEAARRKAKEIGATLLVIDPLATWARLGPDAEKDAGHATVAMTPLLEAAGDGLSVLVIHHAAKGDRTEGDAVRGSSAFLANVDALLELRRSNPKDVADPKRKITTLGRLAGLGTDLVVELAGPGFAVVGSVRDAVVREFHDRVVETMQGAPPEGLTRPEIKKLTKGRGEYVEAAITRMFTDGEIVVVSGTGKRGDPNRYQLANLLPEGTGI
jgi:hypothetical protein